MRKNLLISAVLLAAMIISPLTALDKTKTVAVNDTGKYVNKNTVSVLMTGTGKIEEVNEREYVIGTLAAEIDMVCHEEALKAQAVACFTYLRYVEMQGNTERFSGADISDSSEECQGFLNEEGRRKKWGDKYEEYEKKAEKIADSVSGKLITYQGEPILAAYHELNSGKTESAKTVWGKEYPYLQSVESAGDRLSSDYSKTVMLGCEEFKNCAEKLEGVTLGENASEWFELTDTDEDGYVKKVKVGKKEFTGSQFRDAFELSSCNFSVSYDDERFTIRTIGKGHMVGMSCYGADYMASQGSDYQHILTYYYQNTEIV